MNVAILKDLELPEIEVEIGKVILNRGDRGNKVYVLLSGGVSVTVDKHLLSKEFSPGTIFGEVSSLLSLPHVATVTTIDNCRFYVIEGFLGFLEKNPSVAINVAQTLAYRLVNMNEHFVAIHSQINDLQDRLGNYLPVFSSESGNKK